MFVTSVSLEPVQPFRLDLTVWALRRRAKNQIDDWDGKKYSRIVVIDDVPIKLDVVQESPAKITIYAYHRQQIPDLQDRVAEMVTYILGLNVDLQPFYELAETNEYLFPLVHQFRGVKPPKFPTFFESLGNAVACQQVSLESGLSLLNHLAETFGSEFQADDQAQHAFPDPIDIIKCEPEELRSLGFSHTKSSTLIGVASDMLVNNEFYAQLDDHSRDDIFIHLSELKGIGRWSVEYAMLRGLGRIDILPGDDIAVTKSLQSILQLEEIPNYNQMKELEASLYPYGGMIYFHLILKKLYEKGVIIHQ